MHKEKQRKSISEYVIAATAVFVSFSTLCVYIYQARIIEEHQHISVWPYVQWVTNEVDGYRVLVANKGVGPAILGKVEIKLAGKDVANCEDVIKEVLGDNADIDAEYSTVQGLVLSPGEEIAAIKIPGATAGKEFEMKLKAFHFEMKITYCSVYGDCWTCSGNEVQRVPSQRIEGQTGG